MSTTPSFELAVGPPAGSAGSHTSSLSQQGSIDWVALGRMQGSSAIAVLSRLAGAGIDLQTVAFGQAMCLVIPLGIHGEKVLQDAMKRLTACSSFGDLIWFGFGVRHVLGDLTHTSQGSALVALCAALCEGYTTDICALILYELSRSLEPLGELTPSFSQWQALAKVTGGVFSSSTLGIQISQFFRLSGLPQDERRDPGHPADLAQVIVTIGRLLKGAFETIHIEGGSVCSWIAAWADFVLGLRIRLQSCQGEVIFANYDEAQQDPQLIIRFTDSSAVEADIQCTGSTTMIRRGVSFVQEYFSIFSDKHSCQFSPFFSYPWRPSAMGTYAWRDLRQ